MKIKTGSIFYTLTTSAPAGSLLCNFSSLLASQYPELFNVISYTYGNPSAGYFRIPYLIEVFIRCWDNGAGRDVGYRYDHQWGYSWNGNTTSNTSVGSIQYSMFQAHKHATRYDSTLGYINGWPYATGGPHGPPPYGCDPSETWNQRGISMSASEFNGSINGISFNYGTNTAPACLKLNAVIAYEDMLVPTGAILPCTSVADGYFPLDGTVSSFSSSQFPKLYSAIGTTSLPNLSGHFISTGSINLSTTPARLQSHRHNSVLSLVKSSSDNWQIKNGGGSLSATNLQALMDPNSLLNNNTYSPGKSVSASAVAVEPKSITVKYMIKF